MLRKMSAISTFHYRHDNDNGKHFCICVSRTFTSLTAIIT